MWYAALYRECLAGAQIIFPESGRGLGHMTSTIFGSTVGYPSDNLASCFDRDILGYFMGCARVGSRAIAPGLGQKPQKLKTFPNKNTTFLHFFADMG